MACVIWEDSMKRLCLLYPLINLETAHTHMHYVCHSQPDLTHVSTCRTTKGRMILREIKTLCCWTANGWKNYIVWEFIQNILFHNTYVALHYVPCSTELWNSFVLSVEAWLGRPRMVMLMRRRSLVHIISHSTALKVCIIPDYSCVILIHWMCLCLCLQTEICGLCLISFWFRTSVRSQVLPFNETYFIFKYFSQTFWKLVSKYIWILS